MKSTTGHAIVLVTAPKLLVARRLARILLEQRLIACANIVPRVESHYWWQGRIESGDEVLLVLKTRRSSLRKLEAAVLTHHPYDTPEFLVLNLNAGSKRYLDWLDAETRVN